MLSEKIEKILSEIDLVEEYQINQFDNEIINFDGWLVKNGDRTSIESATIAGDILTLLKNIIQIENKQYETHQGISPHIWVEELAVTGDAWK